MENEVFTLKFECDCGGVIEFVPKSGGTPMLSYCPKCKTAYGLKFYLRKLKV